MSKMTKTIAALSVVAGLGVAALPLSTYAADVDVYATVKDTLSVSVSSAQSEVRLDDIIPGGALVQNTTSVSVANSGSKGYAVKIQGKGGVTTLTEYDATTDAPVTTDAGDAFVAGTLDMSTNSSEWAYRVGEGAWTAVTGSPVTIAGAPTANDTSFDLSFGAKAKNGQKAGTYKGAVTLTVEAEA